MITWDYKNKLARHGREDKANETRFHRISNGQAVDRKDMHGARLVPNNKTDWIVFRDAHPALVNIRLFSEGIESVIKELNRELHENKI